MRYKIKKVGTRLKGTGTEEKMVKEKEATEVKDARGHLGEINESPW